MHDYDGDFTKYQKQLDDAGVDFDITSLCGCTQGEIESFIYSRTRFACKKCNKITKKVKDRIGRASNFYCEKCRE